MTFEKEQGVIIEEEDKEKFQGPHIYSDMVIELVEEMLMDAPNKNKHILAEVSFGLRGIDKKPLFYPNKRVIDNTIKWFYLFKETIELYKEIEEDPQINLDTKGSSKRILSTTEKEYILSVARGAKLPLIASTKQVPTTESIEFLRKGYMYIKEISDHLSSLDKGELIQELKDKGLVPIKLEQKLDENNIKEIPSDIISSYIKSIPEKEMKKDYYVKDTKGKDTVKRIDTQITLETVGEKIKEVKEKFDVVKNIPEKVVETVLEKIKPKESKKEEELFPKEKKSFDDI